LCIARALACNPRLIALDEPSQGLAPKMVEEVKRIIGILRDTGVGVLLVEQNLALAEAVADVIHVMVKGEIVESLAKADFHARREDIIHQYLVL
ncbi:MAG: ABC transporter ATP-binding protein, partial [Alphaproteobacteria bacterium]